MLVVPPATHLRFLKCPFVVLQQSKSAHQGCQEPLSTPAHHARWHQDQSQHLKTGLASLKAIGFSWNYRPVNAVKGEGCGADHASKLNIKPPFGESGGFFVARKDIRCTEGRRPKASQTEISRRATSADNALRFHKLEVTSVQPIDPDVLALYLHRSAGAAAGSPAVDH